MENKYRNLQGWSKTTSSHSQVYEVKNKNDIYEVIEIAKKNKRNISNIGSKRSYGDNFLNDDISIDFKYMNKIVDYDVKNKKITVEPGVTIDQLLKFTINDGLIPPVLPGVRYASIGGCISNNVHGKNVEKNGYFGNYVESITTILSNGEELVCDRDKNSDLFYAIVSGLGLISFIVEVTLKLEKIETYFLEQFQIKGKGINNLLADYKKIVDDCEFSIALLDNSSFNKKSQRYKLTYCVFSEKILSLELKQHKVKKFMFGFVPKSFVPKILRLPFMEMLMYQFMGLWSGGVIGYFKKSTVSLSDYTFQFDQVLPKYNSFFKNGFIEYQCMIPLSYIEEFYNDSLLLINKFKIKPLFTTIKFYKSSKESFHFSFEPVSEAYGVSFHLDNNDNKKLTKLVLELNKLVVKNNGKVYFAKNINIDLDQVKEMFPEYNLFKEMKKKYDKSNLITSNLYKRIFLKEKKYYGQF